MPSTLQLLRPSQWLKNLFVFAPLFFGKHLLETTPFLNTLMMTLAFCMASSSVYCFNDIIDWEADKKHPKKRSRPLASGAVTLATAKRMIVVCLIVAYSLLFVLYSWMGKVWIFAPVTIYLLINIAYSIKLKQYAIVDIFIIAVGFVLRVVAGGFAADVWVSHWIMIMTFLLTLFLALTKRVGEIIQQDDLRASLSGYNLTFSYVSMSILASVTIVCYILYTLDDTVILHTGTPYLYTTTIWVIGGLLRYLQLIMVNRKNDAPDIMVVRDRGLAFCFLGWVSCYAIFLYLK